VNDDDEAVDRERRQLLLMLDRLRRFEAGSLFIAKMISDLEGLLEALEITPDPWRDEFREQWGELEIPYAVSLDRLEPIPDATDPQIRTAVERMLDLVQGRLLELG
jgi:hypothetical protein